MERRKQIEVEEKEVARKEKELIAVIRRPAEAESYKVETLAQAKRLVFCNWTLEFWLLCQEIQYSDMKT